MTQTGTAAGEWVAVPLTDGTLRYDWLPAEQPPSPDGRPGVWRLVPGEIDGYGSWVFFPASPPPVTQQPIETQPRDGAPHGPTPVRRTALVLASLVVVAALIFVFTRGGGDAEQPTGISTLPLEEQERLLVNAATGYTGALLAGNGEAAAGYLDPKACQGKDRSGTRQLATFLSKKAPGATVKVTAVDVSGDNGNVTGYEFSADVPQEVRAVIEQGYTSGGEFSWHLRNGKWFFDAEC